jgi:hypothetical protein
MQTWRDGALKGVEREAAQSSRCCGAAGFGRGGRGAGSARPPDGKKGASCPDAACRVVLAAAAMSSGVELGAGPAPLSLLVACGGRPPLKAEANEPYPRVVTGAEERAPAPPPPLQSRVMPVKLNHDAAGACPPPPPGRHCDRAPWFAAGGRPEPRPSADGPACWSTHIFESESRSQEADRETLLLTVRACGNA